MYVENNNGDLITISHSGGVGGNPKLINACFPVASLFKIILIYGAIASNKIDIDEELFCEDGIARAGKNLLNAREALFSSSNDYFKHLVDRLDSKDIAGAMEDLNFPPYPPSNVDLQAAWDILWRGADIKVCPQDVFLLTERIAKMGCSSKWPSLVSCMEWPKEEGFIRVFGKTGTWGGAAWCTGFAINDKTGGIVDIVTVLAQYDAPKWAPARQLSVDEFRKVLSTSASLKIAGLI